mgnify:CR=1 FL=1
MSENIEPVLLAYVRRTESYFRECSRTDPLFAPEARAAADVLRVLESLGISEAALTESLRLINTAASEEHYNGSVWRDFTNQIREACSAAGAAVE